MFVVCSASGSDGYDVLWLGRRSNDPGAWRCAGGRGGVRKPR